MTPIESRFTATLQTLLRLSEAERTLESRVVFRAEGRPLYALTLEIPADLTVEDVVAPGNPQWSVALSEGRPLLRLFLAKGQLGDFSLVIRGKLGPQVAVEPVPLPRITVEQADRQESSIVVQTDPGFDARVESLEGCQPVLLQQTYGWLAEEQRKLARLAIGCPSADFSGQVRLERRAPRVSCQTVSNLAVTTRAFEETILLDFTIEQAGVRQLSFLLPAELREARISAPLLRQKTVEDVERTGQVRVRLELQDEVVGQFRVLVENDRPLSSEPQSVPIPQVETGQTTQRFVSLETSGREEVLIDQQEGLEPLGPPQQAWQLLAQLLGPGISQAYLVQPDAASPRLVVHTQDRQAVETVGARIPLAQTVLTVDASGAYRGEQIYRVDNQTEQFLEITLPEGALLWTAHVAGVPVKPIAGQGGVRIPLVKTAEGDRDYVVKLKYGGRMEPLGNWAKLSFPLIRSDKIRVEESQARLWLPETHRWFDFGGSMRLADEEGELVAGFLKYKTEQIRGASKGLASSNPFTRLRAQSSLQQLAQEVHELSQAPRYGENERFKKEVAANQDALREAQRLLAEQQTEAVRSKTPLENRKQLSTFYWQQDNEFSLNTVNRQAANFAAPIDPTSGLANENAGETSTGQLAADWLGKSGLSREADIQPSQLEGRLNRGRVPAPSDARGFRGDGVQWMAETQSRRPGGPDVAAGKAIEQLRMQKESARSNEAMGEDRSEDRKLRRFQLELESNADQSGALGGRASAAAKEESEPAGAPEGDRDATRAP